ncbi:alpha/beta fold hydrolase [Occultella glacieicola]|uniref:alpha/beta fold hydrolase n=1 Tax=Occultella glacieicola TaxID=2518684 RepID=UPI0014042E72|nr:alpha/beta fold hydrolase [Occultella glacieicola]
MRLRALRLGFGTLDRFAPELGARWAVRVWATLPSTRGRRRDARPVDLPGTRADTRLPGGALLAVETWGEGPPVYLMHGWGGWRGQLGAFVAPLVAAGHRVVAFDAPSHGDSGPSALGRGRATALEFADALRATVAAHGAPHAVVAHSLGGSAATMAVRDGLDPGRLVLIAASPNPIALTAALPRTLGYSERTAVRFDRRLTALAGRPLGDFDARTMTPSDLPTMIIHDRNDKEVPYTEGADLAAAWPAARFVSTESFGHQRILAAEPVLAVVRDFVTDRAAATYPG